MKKTYANPSLITNIAFKYQYNLSAAENIVSHLEFQNGTAVKYNGNGISLLFDMGIMRLPESGVSFTDLTGRFSPILYRSRESKKLL